MISSTSQMLYRLNNLNGEQERISYQMSTGKKLQYGSDDANTYTRELYIEDKIRVYEGLKVQIEKTNAQNDSSDSALGEAKDLVSYVKAEIIKALNATTDDTAKEAIATNLEGVKENLLNLANERVEGEYLFAGSDSSIPAFTKDASGQVSYDGDTQLRKVAVEDGSYRERGVTGFETFLYTSNSALKGETLTFNETDRIIDQYGNEWKLDTSLSTNTGTLDFNSTQSLIDDSGVVWNLNTVGTALEDASGNSIPVSVSGSTYTVDLDATTTTSLGVSSFSTSQLVQYDIDGNTTGETLTIGGTSPDNLTVNVPTTDGTKFEAKTSIFDLLDSTIDALNKVDSSGNAVSDTISQTALQSSLDEITMAYDSMNNGHARLGGRNKVFDISYERVSAKVFQYEKLQQDVSGVDLAQVATEAKALELTYTALYSTINRMNELSLVNFIR